MGDERDLDDLHFETFTRDRFEDLPAYVERYTATHEVYACVRGFTRPKRQAECAAPSKFAYADLDEVDPRKLPLKLRPHIAIETSPGRYQAVWLCDGYVPSELNQRLTYAIGADKGGWGPSKVLRLVPGTINHKYPTKPRVRLMWDERAVRPPLALSELEKLPSLRRPVSAQASGTAAASARHSTDRADLIARIVPKSAGTLRYNLARTKPWPSEKRSSVIYRHVLDLIELGANDDEIFIIVEPCGFNKWAGDAQDLRDDIERIRTKGAR